MTEVLIFLLLVLLVVLVALIIREFLPKNEVISGWWPFSAAESTENVQSTESEKTTSQCPAATSDDEIVKRFMAPVCDSNFDLEKIEQATINSKVFSDSFKNQVYEKIKNWNKNIPKTSYRASNIIASKSDPIEIDLSSLGAPADRKIGVQGECKRILGIKKTEICNNNTDIRIRVVDLNNLQKYTEKYDTFLHERCENSGPKATIENALTCGKSYQYEDRGYKVMLIHHYYDKSGEDRYAKLDYRGNEELFRPYGITEKLPTTKNLFAKIKFYNEKEIKSDESKIGKYSLHIYYKSDGGPKTVFGPADINFNYDPHTAGKILKN